MKIVDKFSSRNVFGEKRESSPTPKRTSCDHRRTMWIIGLGRWAWCYSCGAIRRLSAEGGWAEKRWTKPVGPGGENPAVTSYDLENPT